MSRIVVLGMIGAYPFGGQTWLFLNWLRGLSKLGHDVWYVEDDVLWPYDGRVHTVSGDWGYAVDHIRTCMARIGLEDRWLVRFSPVEGAVWGGTSEQVDELYRTCDVLLNVIGTRLREPQLAASLRVYVETDPVTHQLLIANDPTSPWAAHLDEHHVVATYGESYGADDCGVPLGSRRYVATRQPIDVELWPPCVTPDATHLTTIGNYRHEGKDVEHEGETYRWSKHHEWERFIDLPGRVDQRFLLAVNVDADDRTRLESHGWEIVAPLDFSLDVFGRYPDFIRRSRGEFTVAKDQNVRLRSGWFSERDACYLASAKPVVAQDTGFGRHLPTGTGLFAVRDVEEASDAVDRINADYVVHCHAAREIAVEHFEASRVAARLLADVGAA